MANGNNNQQAEQFARQLEQRIQQQILDSVNRLLKENNSPDQDLSQSTASQPINPLSTSAPTQKKQQLENVMNGVDKLVSNAIHFGLSVIARQNKGYLERIQRQLKAQMQSKSPSNKQ
ncbi:hypothetical protein CLV97_11245 [Planifilum fimeticola]|uniref:Uncharacterized protein n=1 Tax=Planifilum fimeticola TaxID=201975 RepID=A0A2T0LEK9_9BACL|nr:hypothetical protein [Planifilum fimeticola]PRX40567.1 hypothetical protein CLV97_11245 [Planifilum fimeticola]